MLSRRIRLIGLVLAWAVLGLGATPALAAQVSVAVAANFTQPAKAIAAAFKSATGNEVVMSFGASGGIYTQIAHGAPYDVFLSADVARPLAAEKAGLTVPGSRFTYAVGQLVLYSKTPGLIDPQGRILASGGFSKVAISDPATAPYGAAAVETMKKLGLYDKVKPKIVQGADITQAYQFVQTGAADIGFVALSQVVDVPGGSRWLVPAEDHTPIAQQAVLTKTGANNPAARAFLAFLKSPPAVTIIRKYGYGAQ